MVRLRVVAVAVLCVVMTAGLVVYWLQRLYFPSTDDAYVRAHVVPIAPRVAGQVIAVYVRNNRHVKAGEPLFDLDPARFQTVVDAARGELELAAQDTGANGAAVTAASAALRERQVSADNARRTMERLQQLVKQRLVPEQQYDDALSAYGQARAAVDSARADLERARNQLGQTGAQNARLRAAAAVERAELDLSYTHIAAPAAGWVSDFALRVGTTVKEGQPQFALVEDREWWIEANFRETDLERIRVGQAVRVDVDMYPDVELVGRVHSLSAGSGATFSLLPPENATGNWVKVTQRFPVRIELVTLPPDPATPLRVGASVTTVIDTLPVPVRWPWR
jgi:membrane fusion protein (multidrug efflux system)